MNLRRYQRTALAAGVAGLIATALGLVFDQAQFFRSYLWAYWFWIGVGIGCLQMLMLYQLTGGAWGFVSHRIFEAAARTIPIMFVLVVPLLFGVRSLFEWATPEGRHEFAGKAAYLNLPFFFIRLAVYFAVWGALVWLLDRRDPDRRATVSGPGIVLCTFAVAFASIDWMMSLEPEWFSTVYPLIHATGQVLSGLAVTIIAIALLSDRPPMNVFATGDTLNDLGNLMFTFMVLWAYVQFSQLLITWSGNLPSEIIWYQHRLKGGWQYLALFLVITHFFIPFGLLLMRNLKRRPQTLAAIAVFVLVMRLFEYFWLVEPAFHRGRFVVHWLDIAAPVGIGGLWIFLFISRLASRPVLPPEEVAA